MVSGFASSKYPNKLLYDCEAPTSYAIIMQVVTNMADVARLESPQRRVSARRSNQLFRKATNDIWYMADVAQLVRASGCGSEGRGFDPHHSPQVMAKSLHY